MACQTRCSGIKPGLSPLLTERGKNNAHEHYPKDHWVTVHEEMFVCGKVEGLEQTSRKSR
eukprot:3815849-Amphidinium_carterae.1